MTRVSPSAGRRCRALNRPPRRSSDVARPRERAVAETLPNPAALALGLGGERGPALAIPQVPGVLRALAAAAARGLHAWLIRGEGAALRERGGVADAPGTVGFGSGWGCSDREQQEQREHRRSGANHGHGGLRREPPARQLLLRSPSRNRRHRLRKREQR